MNRIVGLGVQSRGDTVPQARKPRRLFYIVVAFAMAIVVFVGFGPTFYFRAVTGPALHLPPLPSPLVWVHGFVFSSWMLLLLLQTTLVRNGKVNWHRKIGVVAVTLAALMVVLGSAAQVAQTRRDVAAHFKPLDVVAENTATISALLSMVIFAALIVAAVRSRRRPESHKRLMLLATVVLLQAATGRIAGVSALVAPVVVPFVPAVTFGLVDVFILALALHDLSTTGRLSRVTVWGALPILLVQAVSLTPFYGSAVATRFTLWLGNS